VREIERERGGVSLRRKSALGIAASTSTLFTSSYAMSFTSNPKLRSVRFSPTCAHARAKTCNQKCPACKKARKQEQAKEQNRRARTHTQSRTPSESIRPEQLCPWVLWMQPRIEREHHWRSFPYQEAAYLQHKLRTKGTRHALLSLTREEASNLCTPKGAPHTRGDLAPPRA